MSAIRLLPDASGHRRIVALPETLRDPFDCWMVARSLEHAVADGLAAVLGRLRRQGYNKVADAVDVTYRKIQQGCKSHG